jgi:hypothetical protein
LAHLLPLTIYSVCGDGVVKLILPLTFLAGAVSLLIGSPSWMLIYL